MRTFVAFALGLSLFTAACTSTDREQPPTPEQPASEETTGMITPAQEGQA